MNESLNETLLIVKITNKRPLPKVYGWCYSHGVDVLGEWKR